ncbi:MAG: hypothetical protein AVDCRST_MAG18-2050 [uncultured Thermomicrobiales bacterium]|uniref:Uncharacterized protein n=1 Tax=uncultured Thermomicrobiales bacterium TaxID=1645740 RepID=A0A6J4VCG8_9BACT|nr:MAG: hypothetical protein AVDCRST_MAG18-2050 [uncultured Thermomicrobiales bacterium]
MIEEGFVGDGADGGQRRMSGGDGRERSGRWWDHRADVAESPPIPPVVRWRGSAHEYDFGPQESPPERTPKARWRESAHEYDFGGEW